MNPEIVRKIAFRLWPDLETQPAAQQRQGLTLMTLILTLWPYLPLALVWLSLVSDWSVLRQHILLLSLLLLALLFLNERSYQLIIRLSKDVELPFAGSLSDILEVTLLLLFGPTALWLPVMTGLFFAVRAGWRAYREGQSYYIWYPLNILVQAVGANIFVYLVAVLVYDRLGGVYPLAPAVTDWLPALVAILIIVFLTMFIYLPMLLTTNRISGVENSPQTLLPVLGAGSLITLLKTPFAIPLALVYTMAGTAVFLFLVLGVVLANLLAYALSQSNLRTQARSRELAHLEEMGQAIIQAPGDASTLADVVAAAADKGTGAALYMALSRTLIRTYAMQYPDAPAQALAAANARILADTASDQFVTVFYGVLQRETGTFTYANAGHNPAYVVGEETQALANTGIPLGMFGEMDWSEEVVRLGADDVLLIYSDGVSEAQDESRREFGEERLLAAANGAAGRSAQAVQDAVIAAVEAFVGAAPQFDDITLMVARREREDG